MKVKYNITVYDICWLNHAKGGVIGSFYEPETKEELIELCRDFYTKGLSFEIIGYTSNIYFLPTTNIDIVVSTRKVRKYEIKNNSIVADCGVSVKRLSRQMVEMGIVGFDGLIDLPGTVAASVYGNASCYGCSINNLLLSMELLTNEGKIVTIEPDALLLSPRMSAMKRGILKGVILSVTLKKETGNKEAIRDRALLNHNKRIITQPGPQDNLGSIFRDEGHMTLFFYFILTIVKFVEMFLRLKYKDKRHLKDKKKQILFKLLGSDDLLPYVYNWNRFIWKDDNSHILFWKYYKLHQRLFTRSTFEIEIK